MTQKVIIVNKKARLDYFIEEELEAGIVLNGPEVKSLREGKCSIQDSFATINNNEVFIHNFYISPYPHAGYFKQEPDRVRKLLVKKQEIKRLIGKTKEKGYTLIPLQVYFKRGYAKILLGLGKGKRKYDKRKEIIEREEKRRLARILKRRR